VELTTDSVRAVDAVIPVAGLGTRLLPLTRAVPKEMLPIVDKPIVQYVAEELASIGITRVLLVTSSRKPAIREHFDAQPIAGLEIVYALQPHPRGLGDALRCAEEVAAGRPVVVAHGDALIETPPSAAPGIVLRLIATYEQSGASALLAVDEVPNEAVAQCGIVIAGDGLEIEDVVEKPDPSRVRSRTALMGRYVLGPQMFAVLRETPVDDSGEVQLTAALRRAIRGGHSMLAVPLGQGERRRDVGSLEGYCEAFVEYALRDPRVGGPLRARLNL
jgi:UTP--glucose-1-phosphate uridylyltransferase